MKLLDPRLLEMMADLGRWSLEGFWLPLLAWTLVALPAYAAVRLSGDRAPHIRYWTLVALLLSLPLGVAAAGVAYFEVPAMGGVALVTLPAVLTVAAEPAVDPVFAWTSWHTAGLVILLSGLLALWRGASLLAGLRALRRYRTSSAEVPEWIAEETRAIALRLGLTRRVAVLIHDTSSPFTIGWARPLVVLPRDMIGSRPDVRFALTHELIHVRRGDFGLQLVEQVIGAIFFIHPLVTLLRRETTVLREITCDADVLSQTGERSAYARLLLRFSTTSAPERPIAVGIFSRSHQLQERIRAMQSFLNEHGLNRAKQRGIAVFAALLVVAVAAVACSELLVESAPDEIEAGSQASDAEVFVIVEQMPELIGGLASIQQHLRYPELARQAGVEGRVIVQFVVDEEGRVVDPQVVRGIGSGLDEAALEAVRTAEFKPGVQRGVPVPVKMSLPVTFRIDPSDPPPPPRADGATMDESAARPEQNPPPPPEPVEPEIVADAMQIEQLRREDEIVRGRVVDAAGSPVAGVNVVLTGTRVGAVTNPAGEFWFRLAEGQSSGTIQASHVSHSPAVAELR